MANPFDQYDAPSVNPFDRYDAPEAKPSMMRMFKDEALTSLPGGFARGGKDLIDTLAGWASNLGGRDEAARIDAMNVAGKADFKRAQDAVGAGGSDIARIGGNIAATWPVTGLLAGGAKMLGAAPSIVNALRTGGMTTGAKVAPGAAAWIGNQLTRAGAGAATGAGMAGLVNEDDALLGGTVGAVAPAVLQLAGKFGSGVYNAVKNKQAGAGKLLANAMGVSESELPGIIKALNAAPDSIVEGSKLTVNQALQQQGAKQPSIALLERISAGGPGGNALLNRYQEQGAARLNMLTRNGAETYQGAVNDLSNNTGNSIGSILRTQSADDRAVARAAWEKVYGRASADNVRLNLPLDDMRAAMSPLGRGTVGAGNDARAILSEAENIGLEQLPALKAFKQRQPENLQQAVRSRGGIKTGSDSGLPGEVLGLGNRESGTTGLRTQYGQNLDTLAQDMHERGFIKSNDPAELLEALRGSIGGKARYATDAPEDGFRAMAEKAMGQAPGAERFPVSVPFDEFQRLRRSAGALGAKVGARAGGEAEAGVLNKLSGLMTGRADDAANGIGMAGDNVTPEFLSQYNAARDMTRRNVELYKGGNNITSILRKPAGQNYTLGGDEITNKLWHGGGGLLDDVSNLKTVLSDNNQAPALDALRKYVMTDAANKTTAAGNFGAALPKYVEGRMAGLQELMTPDQLKALTGVAGDIRNADAASSVQGLLGSDTQAKISRAMDAGLLDSTFAKTLGRFTSFKGIGLEPIRSKLADMAIEHKGKTIAALLSDPKAAAAALKDAGFVQRIDPQTYQRIQEAARVSLVQGSRTLQAEKQ